MYTFMYYKDYNTCKNAMEYLDKRNIKYTMRDISKDVLNEDEIVDMLEICDYDIDDIVNRYSKKYKDFIFDVKLPRMTYEEKLYELGCDHTLIKNPILYDEENRTMIAGFKAKKWDEFFGGDK